MVHGRARRREQPIAGQPYAQAVLHVGVPEHEVAAHLADRLAGVPAEQRPANGAQSTSSCGGSPPGRGRVGRLPASAVGMAAVAPTGVALAGADVQHRRRAADRLPGARLGDALDQALERVVRGHRVVVHEPDLVGSAREGLPDAGRERRRSARPGARADSASTPSRSRTCSAVPSVEPLSTTSTGSGGGVCGRARRGTDQVG